MGDYNAEDGLAVLNYLGLTNVTDHEKRVFREKWDNAYKLHSHNLIRTTWTLYAESLPFTFRSDENGALALAQLRDYDFGQRLEVTGLQESLDNGVLLNDILAGGPYRFCKTLRI